MHIEDYTEFVEGLRYAYEDDDDSHGPAVGHMITFYMDVRHSVEKKRRRRCIA